MKDEELVTIIHLGREWLVHVFQANKEKEDIKEEKE